MTLSFTIPWPLLTGQESFTAITERLIFTTMISSGPKKGRGLPHSKYLTWMVNRLSACQQFAWTLIPKTLLRESTNWPTLW
jgi:hypothetical protein